MRLGFLAWFGLGHGYLVARVDGALSPLRRRVTSRSAPGRPDGILARGFDGRGHPRCAGGEHKRSLGALPIATQNGTFDRLRTGEQQRRSRERGRGKVIAIAFRLGRKVMPVLRLVAGRDARRPPPCSHMRDITIRQFFQATNDRLVQRFFVYLIGCDYGWLRDARGCTRMSVARRASCGRRTHRH